MQTPSLSPPSHTHTHTPQIAPPLCPVWAERSECLGKPSWDPLKSLKVTCIESRHIGKYIDTSYTYSHTFKHGDELRRSARKMKNGCPMCKLKDTTLSNEPVNMLYNSLSLDNNGEGYSKVILTEATQCELPVLVNGSIFIDEV